MILKIDQDRANCVLFILGKPTSSPKIKFESKGKKGYFNSSPHRVPGIDDIDQPTPAL